MLLFNLIENSFFFRDLEDDADFDATTHLVRVPKKYEIKDAQKTSSAKILIDGMTCQSCVRNIEGFVGDQKGVLEIKVVLEEKTGYLIFDPRETSAEEVAQTISDMGFDASLPNENEEIKSDILKRDFSRCSIHIDGMTCNSCVNNITGMVFKKTFF